MKLCIWRRRVCHFLALALLSVSVQTFASDAIPPPVKSMEGAGFKIDSHFDAGHGLTGWLVSKGPTKHIVYTTADNQIMLVGNIVDASGTNLTEAALGRLSAHPELEKQYAALEASHYIATGDASSAPHRIVYIMFDPNCPFCSAAYQTLKLYQNASVQLRWVPVAYLKSDSAAKAAAILEAKDSAQALKLNEENFDTAKHEGGLAPLRDMTRQSAEVLKSDNDLMSQMSLQATPAWIWKDEHGQIQLETGLPEPMTLLGIMGIAHP